LVNLFTWRERAGPDRIACLSRLIVIREWPLVSLVPPTAIPVRR
jgi:hypothetical protein